MELLRQIESIRTPFLDTIIGLITRLGEETVVVVVFCAIFWCISKKMAYVIGVAFFISGLTVQGMKICFRIDRPWVADPTLNPVPAALEYSTGYSFPSGHTQSAAALFGALGAQMKSKAAIIICFTIPVLVAFSRMYLGVHTLIDVVTSLLICAILIFITLKVLAHDKIDKKREFIISSVMVLYAIVVIITAAILYSNGTIEQKYIADCLKAAGAGIGFAVGMFIERVYIDFSVKSKSLILQILKFVLGVIGVLAIQEGLKLIIGTELIADIFRYFLMLTWVTVFYPLIIKKCFATDKGK